MKYLWFLIIFMGQVSLGIGQDILGGQIRAEQIGVQEYNIFVDVYTTIANHVNRPTITLAYGDGTIDTLPYDFKDTTDIIHTQYSTTHHYPASDEFYIITYLDSFWVDSIKNFPNSINEHFITQLTLYKHSFSNRCDSIQSYSLS